MRHWFYSAIYAFCCFNLAYEAITFDAPFAIHLGLAIGAFAVAEWTIEEVQKINA